MKTETILNAYDRALGDVDRNPIYDRRVRQIHTFRDRIIRMDEDKDARIAELEAEYKALIFAILNGGRR